MTQPNSWIAGLALVLVVGCAGGTAEKAEPAPAAETKSAAQPTIDETIASLESGCAAAADAMAARQAERKLAERLGGRDAIHAVVTDVVRRHRANAAIAHLFDGVDDAHLIDQVTDFLASAAGADVAYGGRDMVTAHEHLAITNQHFLAAGGDVQAALQAAGVGEGEIQEVMCMFASLRDQVVKADGGGA